MMGSAKARLFLLVLAVTALAFLFLPDVRGAKAQPESAPFDEWQRQSPGVRPPPPQGARVVDVDIFTDEGMYLPMYPASKSRRAYTERFWLEAPYGEKYSIRVRNVSQHRVGVVIAVDGRNIVSGAKSNLARNERMYVLEPFQEGVYDGWRTNLSEVHRFYFSSPKESYAVRTFSDESALGTIAVAAYREEGWERIIQPMPLPSPYGMERSEQEGDSKKDYSGSAPASPSLESFGEAKRKSELGTGFGERRDSRAHVVEFRPERAYAQKVVFKYETREELCRKGIIRCGPRDKRNRFWDEEGFAPHPPPGR